MSKIRELLQQRHSDPTLLNIFSPTPDDHKRETEKYLRQSRVIRARTLRQKRGHNKVDDISVESLSFSSNSEGEENENEGK